MGEVCPEEEGDHAQRSDQEPTLQSHEGEVSCADGDVNLMPDGLNPDPYRKTEGRKDDAEGEHQEQRLRKNELPARNGKRHQQLQCSVVLLASQNSGAQD